MHAGSGVGALTFVALDSTQKRVYVYKKEGERFGHTKALVGSLRLVAALTG